MGLLSERTFEEAIECALLAGGPDACGSDKTVISEPASAFGPFASGGFRKRRHEDFDRALCLIPKDVLDFIYATQPAEWAKYKQQHGDDAKQKFLKRLSKQIESRGALYVFRRPLRDSGCKFDLAYFRPHSGLNEDLQRLYDANLFSVVRQMHYSEKSEQSLDAGIFLNGIPVFTAELKNPLTQQTVADAIRQYRTDRDPREPLLSYGRCLAHFAVDPNLVYVTTRLAGRDTVFLPFNRGWDGGAGNPPPSVTNGGYATSYLWERVWARDSILDLIRQFIHEVAPETEKGAKKGKPFLVFPRYHQLQAVRGMVADAREKGAGKSYLGRQRQDVHDRVAGAPSVRPPRRERRPRFRFDRRDHRPPRARPAAAGGHAALRADARRARKHRQDVAPAQGCARERKNDHRDDAPKVSGDREPDQ